MPKWKVYSIGLPVFCSAIAVSWFLFFASTGQPELSDRGGAIGVMVSFGALFLLSTDRYHSIEVLDRSSQAFFEEMAELSNYDPAVLAEINWTRIDAIKADLKYARFQTKCENISLAISSVVSTFFWGFGDVLASYLFSVL